MLTWIYQLNYFFQTIVLHITYICPYRMESILYTWEIALVKLQTPHKIHRRRKIILPVQHGCKGGWKRKET